MTVSATRIETMCFEVLETIVALLADNVSSKRQVRRTRVGRTASDLARAAAV